MSDNEGTRIELQDDYPLLIANPGGEMRFIQPLTPPVALMVYVEDVLAYSISPDGVHEWDSERFTSQGEAAIASLSTIAKPWLVSRKTRQGKEAIMSNQFIPEVGARFMATYIGGVTIGPLIRLPDEAGFEGQVIFRFEDEASHAIIGVKYLRPAHYTFMDAPEKMDAPDKESK